MKSKFYFSLLSSLLLLFLLSACENKSSVSVAEAIPDLESTGGKVFKEFCSACHGLPSPKTHKADEWPNVIERMQVHRVKNAYLPLTDDEKRELVGYLQKHSEG